MKINHLFPVIIAMSVSILFTFTGCVGTYFVNYALNRDNVSTADIEARLAEGDWSQLTENQKICRSNMPSIKEHTERILGSVIPEERTVMSQDGLHLKGSLYRNGDSHLYAVLVHGYTGKREQMLDFGGYFYEWGFNVLCVDNRGHGDSDGKWIGMGWPDSNDIVVWVNSIVCGDPEASIAMFGISMGGATVMMASGLDLPENVKCIVEDCGYSSTYDEFAGQLKDLFGYKPEPILTWADNAAVRMAGYSIKEASSVERLRNAKVPMLFIHGTADTFVPYSMLDYNIAAYGGPYCQVLRIEGAGHAMSYTTDPELYFNTVHDFVFRFCL